MRRAALTFGAGGEYVPAAYPTIAAAYTLVLPRLGHAQAARRLKEVMESVIAVNPEPAAIRPRLVRRAFRNCMLLCATRCA